MDFWISSEMVSTETGVKLARGLGGGWAIEFIQGGSGDGAVDRANCWWMVDILLLKNCRKVVQVRGELLEGRALGGWSRWLTVEKRALVLPLPALMRVEKYEDLAMERAVL